MKDDWTDLLLAVAVILSILVALFCTVRAHAQEHHPQEIHEKFYSTWMMPSNRTISCCHNEDCSPAETRFQNGHWMARKVGETGLFTEIPNHSIETERDTPDGRSHVCGRNSGGYMTVFCFIAGTGG